jgi:hypothetical protein
VVGATVATAVASSNNAAATNNAYAQGYNAGATNANISNANAAAANANAAAANANAAAANADAAAAAANYAVGQRTAVLPAGCVTPNVNGQAYYLCGNTWFSAAYGANGVYYTVVPTP